MEKLQRLAEDAEQELAPLNEWLDAKKAEWSPRGSETYEELMERTSLEENL